MSKNSYPIQRRLAAAGALAGFAASGAACGIGDSGYEVKGAVRQIDGKSTSINTSVLDESVRMNPTKLKIAQALLRGMQIQMGEAFNTVTTEAINRERKHHGATTVDVSVPDAATVSFQLSQGSYEGSLFANFQRGKDDNPVLKQPNSALFEKSEFDANGKSTGRSDYTGISYDADTNSFWMAVADTYTDRTSFNTALHGPNGLTLAQLKHLSQEVEVYSGSLESEASIF